MSELDRIARAYEGLEAAGVRWSLANPGNRAILSERRAAFRHLLAQAGLVPLTGRRALEVGSGAGGELAWLVELGAPPSALVGVDLIPDRVATARRAHPEIDFRHGNAEQLGFDAATFDLVMAITVFSSILDPAMAGNVAAEIARVLRPGGALLWYDVRYDSTNPNVKAVPAWRVRELFPGFAGTLQTVTVLPPIARRLGPATRVAYPALAALPPLRSHLAGLLRKPGSG
jgi:ubiquinone/menaquinone biosynthesis C-methylase UbiE